MPHDIINPWELDFPNAVVKDEPISGEMGRWERLLNDPLGFVGNIHRYGPVDHAGYYMARNTWQLRDHIRWPKDPMAIADLMIECGVTVDDAGVVAMDHRNTVDHLDHRGFSELFAIHLAILKRHNVVPNSSHLLDALRYHDWGDQAEFHDFFNCFDIMRAYLPTVADETNFLKAWLPNFIPESYSFGFNESFGLAIAAKFPDADPASIISWCKLNDDPVGLGYLVWQGRYPLKDWLLTVCDSMQNPDDDTRRNNYSSDDSVQVRGQEQLDTMIALVDRLPKDILAEQGRLLCEEYPEEVETLLDLIEGGPFCDDYLKWSCMLFKAGALPRDHEVFTTGLDNARAVQEATLENLRNGSLTDSRVERENLYNKVHQFCGPIAMDISESMVRFLVRDLALRGRPGELDSCISGMDNKNWLEGVPVADIIHARVNGGMQCAVEVIAPLFPFMTDTEKCDMAKLLVQLGMENKINTSVVKDMLWRVAPMEFDRSFKSEHTGVPQMLHYLTKKDPEPLMNTISALDIKEKDPLFLQMIGDWIDNQFTGPRIQLALPESLSDDVLGF